MRSDNATEPYRQGDDVNHYFDGSELYPAPAHPERRGLIVRPRRGTALLWWNLDPGGGLDVTSRHAGCPLVSGEKQGC